MRRNRWDVFIPAFPSEGLSQSMAEQQPGIAEIVVFGSIWALTRHIDEKHLNSIYQKSIFLRALPCRKRTKIWCEIFYATFSRVWVCEGNFTKISFQKGVKNGKFHANFTLLGRSADPNPPEFAQPRLSRSNGGRPEGTNLDAFAPVWLILPLCEAPKNWVCLMCVISTHSNAVVQIRVGLAR